MHCAHLIAMRSSAVIHNREGHLPDHLGVRVARLDGALAV